jgi:hypothetical protein
VIGSYIQVTPQTTQLWTRRYSPGSEFTAPLRAAETAYIEWVGMFPSVALDDRGVATVAWAQATSSTGTYQVYTNRLGATDTAWPSPMMMETDNAAAMDDTSIGIEQSPMPLVRTDPAGNVTLLWRKRVGTRFDLYARRFAGMGPWGAPELLETQNTGTVYFPALGVGANGTAVAVWYYYGAELDAYANVYR